MWLLIFILPTILLNLTTLMITLGKHGFFKTILFFPPLLLQGLFGIYLFGPVDGIRTGKMSVSKSLTLTNFIISLLQQGASVFILSRNFAWRFLMESGMYCTGCLSATCSPSTN